MEILVLWIIFAIVGACINGFSGFIWGFLLGPIGWIIAAFGSSKKQRRREHREMMALFAAQGAPASAGGYHMPTEDRKAPVGRVTILVVVAATVAIAWAAGRPSAPAMCQGLSAGECVAATQEAAQ